MDIGFLAALLTFFSFSVVHAQKCRYNLRNFVFIWTKTTFGEYLAEDIQTEMLPKY